MTGKATTIHSTVAKPAGTIHQPEKPLRGEGTRTRSSGLDVGSHAASRLGYDRGRLGPEARGGGKCEMQSDEAKRALDAAKAKAGEMGKAVSIIVVDAAAIPVVLERVGDAAAFTTVVAEGKACASAFVGRDSGELQGMAERFPSLVQGFATRLGGRFVALQGAVVLLREGAVIGAVGVSGATAEEDEAIARAGADAFGAGGRRV